MRNVFNGPFSHSQGIRYTQTMNKRFTPENITSLKSDEVFVFGSNLGGNHAGGAARVAHRLLELYGIKV